MKILVPVKRVIDYNVKVRVKPDNSAVELTNVKMAMNPFDEIAIEQALRIKEASQANEVIAVSIGPQESQDTIRTALAMGADRGILVKTEQDIEPLAVAKILKKLADKEEPRLIILGKQSIDDDCNQTGQMLSAFLDWPQVTFISDLKFNQNNLNAIREVDGGLEHIECKLPAIVTVHPLMPAALLLICVRTTITLSAVEVPNAAELKVWSFPPPVTLVPVTTNVAEADAVTANGE